MQSTIINELPDGYVPPPKTRWIHIPSLWKNPEPIFISGNVLTGSSLGKNVTLHHDGQNVDFTISRPDSSESRTNFQFSEFSGSYVSIAFGLTQEGIKDITRNDLLRFVVHSNAANSIKAYIRLNLNHGPNTESITRMIDLGVGQNFVEFDIFYTEYEPIRAKDAWIDLIFNDPQGTEITIDNVIILRRMRASL